MRAWLIDLYDWIFMQEGFSWKEWRSLTKSSGGTTMPENWNGDW